MVFIYATLNMKSAQMSVINALKLGDKMFYAYSTYDTVNKVGRVILVGRSPRDDTYKVYLDSDDYYNPRGIAGYPIIGPFTNTAENYTYLKLESLDYGNIYYELLYDSTKDQVEYQQ